MPTGFAGLVVDEVDLRELHQHRPAVPQLELQSAGAPDDLLGRDAVDRLGKHPHELRSAAGRK
jgi:hypothetical protein